MSKEEEKKTARDYTNHKLMTFWLTIVIMLVLSVGLVDFVLNGKGKYGAFFYVNPFSKDSFSQHYFKTYYWFPAIALFVTFIMRVFFFGNTKRKYIKALENTKRKLLMILPFYIDGKDSRNNYIRFGMQTSFKHGFLERKIQQGHYLEKVKHLHIFTGKMSPDYILCLRSDYIPNAFLSRERYVEMFKIIEGYVKKNIDTVQNIPLKNYSALGSNQAYLTEDSIKTFIKIHVPEQKVKAFKYGKNEAKGRFDGLLSNLKQKPKSSHRKYKKKFLEMLTNGDLQKYNNHVRKMVILSPLAIKEYIEMTEKEAVRFLTRHKKLRTSTITKLNEYGKVDEKYFIEIVKFVTFYKTINYFLGLPSGIVTARIEDYTISRIIDDIELFEKSTTIRQIKPYINDKKGKYNDTIARAYMIFHHELMNNSQNSDIIKKFESKFDALKDMIDNDAVKFSFPEFEGTEEDKQQYIESHKLEDGWVYKPIKEESEI